MTYDLKEDRIRPAKDIGFFFLAFFFSALPLFLFFIFIFLIILSWGVVQFQ